MKKLNLLLGTALSMLMSFSAVVPVSAATSTITVKAEPTTVNVTVPATAPMVFNADGTNTVPRNFTIENKSIGGIYLKNIKLEPSYHPTYSWKIAKEGTNLKALGANSPVITLKLGAAGAEKSAVPNESSTEYAKNATVTFEKNDFVIPADGSKTLSFVVDRCAFTSVNDTEDAFDMTLNFDFN